MSLQLGSRTIRGLTRQANSELRAKARNELVAYERRNEVLSLDNSVIEARRIQLDHEASIVLLEPADMWHETLLELNMRLYPDVSRPSGMADAEVDTVDSDNDGVDAGAPGPASDATPTMSARAAGKRRAVDSDDELLTTYGAGRQKKKRA